MSRYRPYPSYKESGVAWLGEVPEYWEIKRLKFLCQITTGGKDTVNAVEFFNVQKNKRVAISIQLLCRLSNFNALTPRLCKWHFFCIPSLIFLTHSSFEQYFIVLLNCLLSKMTIPRLDQITICQKHFALILEK